MFSVKVSPDVSDPAISSNRSNNLQHIYSYGLDISPNYQYYPVVASQINGS